MALNKARNWWSQTVYPPRYFCGFLKLSSHGERARRVDFIDAPLIPLDEHSCALFAGERGGCFYASRLTGGRYHVHEIQYAISVMDTGRGRVRVEKFNHAFKYPGSVILETTGGLTRIRTTGGGRVRLYDRYPLSDVFDRFSGVSRPVLQFVA